jgi:hypothetical protein
VVAVNESRSAESHFEFEFEDVDVMMDGSFVDPAANAKKRKIDSAQVGSPTHMYVGVSSFVCRTPMAACSVGMLLYIERSFL